MIVYTAMSQHRAPPDYVRLIPRLAITIVCGRFRSSSRSFTGKCMQPASSATAARTHNQRPPGPRVVALLLASRQQPAAVVVSPVGIRPNPIPVLPLRDRIDLD